MKKIILIAVISFVIVYLIREKIYKPYLWKKAMSTKEHQLQVGSFIFSKQRGSNGSQSYENQYFVFKVTEMNGDYVRLSVIRQLSPKDSPLISGFSTNSNQYKALKENIQDLLITPILSEDLYKGDGPRFTVNDYLTDKYSNLRQSLYYYEVVSQSLKNSASTTDTMDAEMYFELVYSKKDILEKAKLTPYHIRQFSSDMKPELSPQYSANIDLIKN